MDNFADVLGDVDDAAKKSADAVKDFGVGSDEAAEAARREEDAIRDAHREIATIAREA
jgi:hypothetical protein